VCVGLKLNERLRTKLGIENLNWIGKIAGTGDEVLEFGQRRQIVSEIQRRAPAHPTFFNTSCAISYLHGLPEYNGTYIRRKSEGPKSLCTLSICPDHQRNICKNAFEAYCPSKDEVLGAARHVSFPLEADDVEIIGDHTVYIDARITQDQHRHLTHLLKFPVRVSDLVRTTEWAGNIAEDSLR
jgi:hypothetical protein